MADQQTKQLIASAVRQVLIKLALYRMDNLSVARSNDVLKQLYQNLVPDVLRKSLGEFYTPDWLVDVVMDRSSTTDWLSVRILDPTCGSGSFVLAAIRRIRQAAEAANWDSKELLLHIIESVWGFDLNPLAVQAARVNFLIAVSDLIRANPGFPIELPILLADAIYSPAEDPESSNSVVEYRIGSQFADLKVRVPAELVLDRNKLDAVFDVLGELVDHGRSVESVSVELLNRGIITQEEAARWETPLTDTYARVLALHNANWNGIWFRVVRNFFWSATAGFFDLVIGNPPWVRWSRLPELYRHRVKPTCERYDIFSDTPYHGGNELDISAMITYSVADKWLKEGGKLVFVITQTHFQAPSSQGFRRFNIDDIYNLVPESVEDLTDLKPFADAANKTAIFSAVKTKKKPIYPVRYALWHPVAGMSRALPVSLSKAAVLQRVSIDVQEASPVGGSGSPWAIMPVGQFPKVQKLSGVCSWVQGRKGITTDRNGIYFVRIVGVNPRERLVQIETRPDAGKSRMGVSQRFWIEPDLLYPLVKGAADIKPCYFEPQDDLYVIVPNTGIVKDALAAAERRITSTLPRTYKYFRTYERVLAGRSTFRTRMKDAPFFSIYNVGSYTFAPWKVIWAEQPGRTQFPSAVVGTSDVPLLGKRVLVPDHKVFFADFDAAEPAYYLCGLLNSSTARTFIQSHVIASQVGNIFKHMRLPRYNQGDPDHRRLVDWVRAAHNEPDTSARGRLVSQISALGNSLL